ncbi:GNAT family N-acetyltransferase [Nostoc sp. FACHB-152]|uniref:GNAT family N-acetyltransferase n=1 Tax=unclassified Nostoc TaxID=2593658 RepID=UPI0016887A91|nr:MULTISPECIES: GNAT family N-acetyltransferase [unclassified Nostoc]MBD2451696.1 GNAT family N-acetyltransferase [Nostoc sp. FACHB-152]MBD2472802.1 GNAT family N-acetyltransferase [Nostoc sp. FACHB-145]
MRITKTSNFDIRAVTTTIDNEMFLDVPAKVYANDPYWISPLRSNVAKQFSPHNTFFEYGKLQQFIAVSREINGSQAVGRIVAAINQRLINRENQNVGLFGFFECVSDFTIAQALLDAACKWLREQGMTVVRGPIDLSTHNNCLFLVDGFDSSPMVMMPYNPPYYPELMERDGWHKAKDSYAYNLLLDKPLPPEFEKAYRIACKSGVSFRSIQTKGDGFEQDAKKIYHLFNRAFANNWSSTPRTETEFMEEAKDLKDLIDPDIFVVAEYNGEMVGFFMALPDYNIPLKYVKGILNWLGIIKFLWYRRYINQARVIAICSLPEYRRKMVSLALIYLGMQGGIQKAKPYKSAELSWVFEDNFSSRQLIEATGAKIYKTYRIYEKLL